MTPSFIGRYAMMSPGVLPIISLASFPTARILLSATETATTEGSFSTIPFPGTKTRTVVVPRSMPSFGENENDICECGHCTSKLVWRIEYGVWSRDKVSPHAVAGGDYLSLVRKSHSRSLLKNSAF